jgi:hypothetical protein
MDNEGVESVDAAVVHNGRILTLTGYVYVSASRAIKRLFMYNRQRPRVTSQIHALCNLCVVVGCAAAVVNCGHGAQVMGLSCGT